MTIILYGHRLSQPCRAVEIVLRELALTYHWQAVDFSHNETHEPWFAEINPFCKIPALYVPTCDDVDTPAGSVLGESHAILRYLCHIAPARDAATQWYPGEDNAARTARIDQWLAWHHNNIRRHDMFHHIMNLHLTLPMLKREIQQTLLEPLQESLNRALTTLEAHFERQRDAHPGQPTLCGYGHPTIADLSIACELYQIVAVGYRLGRYPSVARWLDAMAQRAHFRNISTEIVEHGRTIREASGDYLALDRAFG